MSKKLLLADDSITIQKVIGIIFANEDYQVTTVDNGDDALVKARAERPDLILADVHMPGKDGYELTAAVRQDAALATVPVLLLSGTFEAFDEGRAEGVGADGWIAKPFESQSLIDRVDELLARAPVVEATPVVEPPAAAAPEPEVAPVAMTPEVAVVEPEPAADWEEDFGADEDIWGDVSFGEEDLGEEPLAAPEAAPAAAEGVSFAAPEAPAAVLEEDFTFEEEPLTAPEAPAAALEEDFTFEEEPLTAPEAPAAALEEDFTFGADEEEIYILDEADILEEEELEPVFADPVAEGFGLEEDAAPVEEELPAAFEEPAVEDFSFAEEGPEWGIAEEPLVEEPLVEEPPAAAVAAVVPAPVAPALDEEKLAALAEARLEEMLEQKVAALADEQLEKIVEKVAGVVIERLADTILEKIAWEVVPDLAEVIIRDELRMIREESG